MENIQKLINDKRPFDRNQLPQLLKFYKAETTWSSNALEGNGISLGETELIIEKGITIHGHTLREIYECVGHADAFDYMNTLIYEKKITEDNIKKLHKILKMCLENTFIIMPLTLFCFFL